MKPCRELRAARYGNPRRLDGVIGERRILRVALALPGVVRAVLLVVRVEGPLRGGPVNARHEIALAGGHQIAIGFGGLRPGLAPARDRLERRRGIGELGDALTDRREVGIGFRAARNGEIDGPRLIPIHPDGANRVVEQPALLGPAPRERTVVRQDLASHGMCGRTPGLYCGPRTLASERPDGAGASEGAEAPSDVEEANRLAAAAGPAASGRSESRPSSTANFCRHRRAAQRPSG